MEVDGNLKVSGSYIDSDGESGVGMDVLMSTVNGTKWSPLPDNIVNHWTKVGSDLEYLDGNVTAHGLFTLKKQSNTIFKAGLVSGSPTLILNPLGEYGQSILRFGNTNTQATLLYSDNGLFIDTNERINFRHISEQNLIQTMLRLNTNGALQFYADNSAHSRFINGRWGFNTTNPIYDMHIRNYEVVIQRTVGDNILRMMNTSGLPIAGGIDMMESSGEFGTAGQYGARMYYDGSANTLNFKMGNSSNVFDALTIVRNGGHASFGGRLGYGTQGGLAVSMIGVDANGNFTNDISSILPTLNYWTKTGSNLSYENGDIGIGTTGFERKLSIVGDIGVGVSDNPNTLGLEIKGIIEAIPSASVRGYIATGNSQMGVAGDLIIAPRTSVVASTRFITRNGDETPTERMRINHDGNVGIGTDSPIATLDVDGSVAKSIKTVSGAYTVTNSDHTILVSGNSTISLPPTTGIKGLIYVIKKIDSSANIVTISANSGQNIDGNVSYQLTSQYQSIRVQTDGANWYII